MLAVDDDPNTQRFVREALAAAGYAPTATGAPDDLGGLIRAERPELVVLELPPSGGDGLRLLAETPELSDLPVVLLSAYGRDGTVARALELGAEDYVVKPFSATELAVRVGTALRRRREPEPFVLGDLAIDYARGEVSVRGAAVELTATEYKVLRLLSLNAGRLVHHETILRRVWSERETTDASLIRVVVRSLRRKLGDSAGEPVWIFNRRGVGYRMPGPGES